MMAVTPEEFAARFPQAHAVFAHGVAKGLHLGAQVYISKDIDVLADVGLGKAVPGEPMTADHVTLWLSAGKPLTAVLIGQLVEAGRIDWDDPIARHIPEFANRGKERITLRHTLTHMAGLRHADTGWPEAAWDETIARLCGAPLDDGAIPGQTAGYHVASTWFLLGEVVQRVTGRGFAEVMREKVSGTLGSVPDTGTIAPLWERVAGQLQMLDWHLPPRSTRPSPGSSLRGPIRELGRFYEMLLGRGAVPGGRALQASTVDTMTQRQRIGYFDQTLLHVVDMGFGFLIDSNRYGADTVPYGYGRHCSPYTFGHGGAQSSQGYCDPDYDLVVAYHFNGRCGEPQHQRRARAFNEAVYRDLGCA
jgi:CubicO group peptidase (beta-lactamase class C family)